MSPITSPPATVDRSTADLVLEALLKATAPLDVDHVVAQVQAMQDTTRGVQVKIAALCLVSQGLAAMDSDWRLSTIEPIRAG